MLMRKLSSLLAGFLVAALPVSAQFGVRDSAVGFSALAVTGAYQFPGGELADRFGNNFAVGASFLRKTAGNWIWWADGNFIFGGEVKENDILSGISTSQGYIIASNGTYADVYLHERGYAVFLKAGKLFPVFGPNENSGITLTLGAGFLQHKIFIEDKGNLATQLSSEYKKGYDRLSNGLCLSQFAGYSNFSNNRRINFYAGLEAWEGFTKNRRTVNFDTGLADDINRLDVFIGIRIGWIFPLYKRMPRDIYYD
jgi:hypothetical protein